MTKARSLSDFIESDGSVTLVDNQKIKIGTGSDLQIYHDGSNSYVNDNGTGDLVLKTAGAGVQMWGGGDVMFNAVKDGAVTLYYDNAVKLATTSTGIDVTGTATMDGLTVNGTQNSKVVYFDDSSEAGSRQLQFTSSNNGQFWDINSQGTSGGLGGELTLSTRSIDRLNIDTGGDISFYEDTGSTAKLFWDASAESLGIGTTSPSAVLETFGGTSFIGAKFKGYSGGKTALVGGDLNTVWFGDDDGSIGLTNSFKIRGASNTATIVTNSETRMTVDGSGAVGIGVVPQTNRFAGHDVLQIGARGTFLANDTGSSTGQTALLDNLFYNSAGNYRVRDGSNATAGVAMQFVEGNVIFSNSAATTGDPTVTQRMIIDDEGHVGINMTPSPVGNDKVLSIYESNTPRIKLHNSSTGTAGTDGGEINMSGTDFVFENREAGNLRFFNNGSETTRINSAGSVIINRYTSGLQTFSPAKLVIGTGVTAGNEATGIMFDDMGARDLGTAQTIDFIMGRTNVTPDAAKAQIVALMEGNSATSVSHGIGYEFRTAINNGQETPLRIRASGGVFKFNTSETPQSGNPRTARALVIGPSEQGSITQGLTNATALQNRGGELYAVDHDHNNTQITPHNWELIDAGPSEELAWTYWSQRPNPDNNDEMQGINVDMAKVIRKVEDLVGEKLVYTENSNMDDHTHQTIIADIQTALANLTTRIEALEG